MKFRYFNLFVIIACLVITGLSLSACGIKGKIKNPTNSKMNRVYPYE